MSEVYDGYTCDECDYHGMKVDPISGLTLSKEYNGEMLCSSCRVDKRLEDGDYSND
jgi:hypothetical protein